MALFSSRALLALAAAASTLLPAACCKLPPGRDHQDGLHGSLERTFAPVGQSLLNHWQFIADMANTQQWAGEHRFGLRRSAQ